MQHGGNSFSPPNPRALQELSCQSSCNPPSYMHCVRQKGLWDRNSLRLTEQWFKVEETHHSGSEEPMPGKDPVTYWWGKGAKGPDSCLNQTKVQSSLGHNSTKSIFLSVKILCTTPLWVLLAHVRVCTHGMVRMKGSFGAVTITLQPHVFFFFLITEKKSEAVPTESTSAFPLKYSSYMMLLWGCQLASVVLNPYILVLLSLLVAVSDPKEPCSGLHKSTDMWLWSRGHILTPVAIRFHHEDANAQ